MDLRSKAAATHAMRGIGWAYCLAANMGGMGFIAKESEQAAIYCGNARINLNCALAAGMCSVERVLFSSSACVYPEFLQLEATPPMLREEDAYPAWPDTEYGWEKLMSERAYMLRAHEYGYAMRIARFHNVYGPQGSWNDGREKAPAALSRKVAEAKRSGDFQIEVWGDGLQTRSFCYVSDAIEMILCLMASDHDQPLNIGTDRAVSINELVRIIAGVAGIEIELVHDLDKPQGVRGRNADLSAMRRILGCEAQVSLEDGIAATYNWIEGQVISQGAAQA
jgi:nucleoside-diphosphate-sugar epimerase